METGSFYRAQETGNRGQPNSPLTRSAPTYYNQGMSASKIDIVGIGDDGLEGLTTPAKQLVERAELLVGTRQSLDAVTASTAEKIEIGGDLDAVVRKVDAAGRQRIVVLAAGDPMFYGTARYLCDRLGK